MDSRTSLPIGPGGGSVPSSSKWKTLLSGFLEAIRFTFELAGINQV